MIFIPFIYFSTIFLFIWIKRRRLDLSSLLAGVYATTSFLAILIDKNGLYGEAGCVRANISAEPVILYCLLISISIAPFYSLNKIRRSKMAVVKNPRLFTRIVNVFFLSYILFLFFFLGEIISRLNASDIASLRIQSAIEGDTLGFSKYSGLTRILARLVFIISSAGMSLQLFYFYSVAFFNKRPRYNRLILICSTSPILIGLLSLDRSKTVYWLLSFVALYVIFRDILEERKKNEIRKALLIFSIPLILYLTFMTAARYGQSGVGSFNSIAIYGGQAFNNFCLFYNKLDAPGFSLDIVFPVMSAVYDSDMHMTRAELYAQRNIDTNVFASFSGILIREIGVLGSSIYVLIYSFFAFIIFKFIRNYSLLSLSVILFLYYIPFLGVFGLFYSSVGRVYSAWFFLITSYFLGRKMNFS